MAHKYDYARRLLRELPKEPKNLLQTTKYADPTFLPLFYEHLDELIFRDPQKALPWAKIVPDLALASSEEEGPEGRQINREQLVMAWVIFGGAHRACGDHDSAEDAYDNSFKIIASEAIGPLVRACAEYRLSYLRACQDRQDEALKLAKGAVKALRELKTDDPRDVHLRLGEALISYGYVLVEGFKRYAEGIDAFGEALILAGPAKDPARRRIHLAACLNLAYAIAVSCDSDSRAMGYLNKAKTLLKGQRRTPARYRLLWVEGLIWSKRGMHAKAEVLFLQALEGFQVLKLPFEIAIIGLDLGAVYQICGDWSKLKTLASETYERFCALDGTSEAVAALSQWLDAVRKQELEDKVFYQTRGVILKGISSSGCCKIERRRRPA